MAKIQYVRAFADNYIWIIGTAESPAAVIVDPGDADPVERFLREHHCRPEAILLTHHHADHTGGVAALTARHDLAVYGPAREAIPGVTHPLEGGERIDPAPGALTFEVVATPGHTRGHLSYVGDGALFCGDTLFTAGCGRLFEGGPEQMYHSLDKLRALPDETQVYCAHEYTLANLAFARVVEPKSETLRQRDEETKVLRRAGRPTVPATLALEKATNPFLRCHLPGVVQAAEGFAGRSLQPGAETFAVVRHWKDTLD
jgi:hydroxyacylglutathione hydrolase